MCLGWNLWRRDHGTWNSDLLASVPANHCPCLCTPISHRIVHLREPCSTVLLKTRMYDPYRMSCSASPSPCTDAIRSASPPRPGPSDRLALHQPPHVRHPALHLQIRPIHAPSVSNHRPEQPRCPDKVRAVVQRRARRASRGDTRVVSVARGTPEEDPERCREDH